MSNILDSGIAQLYGNNTGTYADNTNTYNNVRDFPTGVLDQQVFIPGDYTITRTAGDDIIAVDLANAAGVRYTVSRGNHFEDTPENYYRYQNDAYIATWNDINSKSKMIFIDKKGNRHIQINSKVITEDGNIYGVSPAKVCIDDFEKLTQQLRRGTENFYHNLYNTLKGDDNE